MNESELKSWLEGYRRAWETRDPEAAAAATTDPLAEVMPSGDGSDEAAGEYADKE